MTNWGTAVPPGRILMEKKTGGDPLFLLACVKNPTTLRYNTPCLQPETVTGNATNKTTTDSILMAGLDVHFARRVATAANGTSAVTGYVITPYVGTVAKPAHIINPPVTTATITGLTSGTAYTFKVAAKNAIGTSPPSVASRPITPT